MTTRITVNLGKAAKPNQVLEYPLCCNAVLEVYAVTPLFSQRTLVDGVAYSIHLIIARTAVGL